MSRQSKSQIFESPPAVSSSSSEINLITWSEVGMSRSIEGHEVAESCVEKVLKNVEDFVGGKFYEKTSCSVIPLKSKLVELEEEKEDHRLANWKRWLTIHEKQSKKIQKQTFRRRGEMLLNTNPNDRRQILNRQETLEKSSNAFGALNFWKIPEMSREKLLCTLPKSCRIDEIDEIVYTQTPDLILKEQKLGKAQPPKPLLMMVQERVEQRVENLREPSMERLALKGNDFGDGLETNLKQKQTALDSIRLSSRFSQNYEKLNKVELPQVLVIQGIRVDNVIPDKNVLVDLVFRGFKLQRQTKVLRLENRGVIAINVTLKKTEVDEVDKILSRPHKTFFFNKFPFRIIPGETLEVPFHFYPTQAGVYQESWVISCEPQFSRECQIIVSLLGHCQKKYKINEELEAIENEIMRKAAESDVEQVMKGVIEISIGDCKPTCRDMFKDPKEIMFSKMNPKLFYHIDSVEEMAAIHKEIAGDDVDWNFDVEMLYKMILEIADQGSQKDFYNRFMNSLNLLKNIRSSEIHDDESSIKFSLARNVLGIFFEGFEKVLNEDRESLDQEASIKENLCVTINKIVCILES